MKVNKWTAALASAGVLSGVSAVQAEESPVMTALASTTISGYVDVAGHWNLGEQGNQDDGEGSSYGVPNYGKNESSKTDGFNLNVVNLTIAKPLDESQWAAGYKAELLFGPDAVNYNLSSNASGGDPESDEFFSDFGIKQAYVELRTPVGNGLDFKVGVFDTILGYESFNNGSNPNYTRSWAWSIQPTQHTGVLASYAFNETISATAGVANTHASGINSRAHYTKSEADKTAMGSIAITAPESSGFLQGSTLYGGAIYGFSTSTGDNQANYYTGATIATPVEGLSVGLAYDYVHQNGGGNTSGDTYQNVYGLYASFQATEKVSLHLRGEYADGEVIYTTNSGENGEIWSITGTVEYDLWANVLTRLEVRYDNAEDGQNSLGWREDDQWLIAINMIYNF